MLIFNTKNQTTDFKSYLTDTTKVKNSIAHILRNLPMN